MPGDVIRGAELVAPPAMSGRDVALAMIALIMSMFVALLSNTVVLTAMPKIVAGLHGTQADYTWIVTSSLLTLTICVPIWGRMSDLLNKKLLVQCCVGGYVGSSVCAAFATAPWQVIICRIGIGICAGGMIALTQSLSVEIVHARERARWVGYRSAALSVATLGAPSLGGLITDHFGWRWCFVIGVPFAIVAIAMLQYALHLPRVERRGRIRLDWPGTFLLAAGVVALMSYVSVAGPQLGWHTAPALLVFAAGVLMLSGSMVVELRSNWPLLPVGMLRQPDIALCALASGGAGITLFCSAVFLAIYLQIGRGLSASTAGLMALPEASGTLIASLLAGHLIARHGRYRRALIFGASLVLCGFLLLSTLGTDTPLVWVGLYVAMVGAGLGIVAENLVLVVQNIVGRNAPGSAGALVVFARSLAAVFCVAVLGVLLSSRAGAEIRAGGALNYAIGSVPSLTTLSPDMRALVQHAYAHGVASIYLACVPAALLVLGCVCLLRDRVLEK